MSNFKSIDGKSYKEIFCKYIVRNGRRIYPKTGSCFHFWVRVN